MQKGLKTEVIEDREDIRDYEELKLKYKKLCDDHEKLQAKCQSLCGDIELLQSQKPRQTLDEEEIRHQWQILMFSISNLTEQKFHGKPLKGCSKSQEEFFKRLTDDPDRFLKSGSKPLLIQAAIWSILADRLLSKPCGVYQDEAGVLIRQVERMNRRMSIYKYI